MRFVDSTFTKKPFPGSNRFLQEIVAPLRSNLGCHKVTTKLPESIPKGVGVAFSCHAICACSLIKTGEKIKRVHTKGAAS